MQRQEIIAGWLGLLSSACVSDSEPRVSQVDEPRILTVLSDQPEAEPGAELHYRALAVDRDGPLAVEQLRWSLCLTPRALTENTSVSSACAEHAEQPLAARGLEINLTLPLDGCARFGSETSLGKRPVDPDQTGGYYQPVRLTAEGLPLTIVRQRILCPLANAPIDAAQRFARSYQANTNPGISELVLRAQGEQVSPEELPARAAIELNLHLAEDARESYPVYDALSGRLTTRNESLSAQWFVSAGELAADATHVSGLSTNNRFVAPEAPQALWLWIVVRDERGGVSALSQPLQVSP